MPAIRTTTYRSSATSLSLIYYSKITQELLQRAKRDSRQNPNSARMAHINEQHNVGQCMTNLRSNQRAGA